MVLMGLVLSGVCQGCPLASLLHIAAAQPFSLLFEQQVCQAKLGLVRQCADDIGAAIVSLDVLKAFQCIFESMRTCANQVLNVLKCVVVPLAKLSGPHSKSPTMANIWASF